MSKSLRERRLALLSPAATAQLAARLAAVARAGDVFALKGPLGVGKTTFARAFLRALGVAEEVPSPTFSLVQIYPLTPVSVWHFDFYRVDDARDALELGIEEAFEDGIALIEWPERLGALLPDSRLDLYFEYADAEDARWLALSCGEAWDCRLGALALDD